MDFEEDDEQLYEHFRMEVDKGQEPVRIDKFLSEHQPHSSRNRIQKAADAGFIHVNDRPVKSNYKVRPGDIVTLMLDRPHYDTTIEPEDIPLDVVFEDDDLMVINKPKGMVVHPAPGHYTGTLVNAVLFHCGQNLSGINGVLRPGIVHRIDKDTTGSLLVCKNDLAHRSLAQQLKDHSIRREYRAICRGVLKQDEMFIDKPIGRDPSDRLKMAVVPDGRSAQTNVRVIRRFPAYTEVRCILNTGRTHQIRVHMASVGYPLLGDPLYGISGRGGQRAAKEQTVKGQVLEGQCLHAEILGFTHPRTGEYIETTAPLPEYYQKLLDVL